jgi:hypothetical protein
MEATASSTPRASARWTALAALPALALFALQAGWPWPFFSDDSFISLRYAARLLDGDGLTWTDGEVVEGYSNLLWVLLTAGLGALGVELVAAARLLGALCTVAALWALAAALRPRDLRGALTAAVAPLLVAATQPVMIWSLAGLEGPLMLALLAWGFGGLLRRHVEGDARGSQRSRELMRAGLPFALACWTRPDGPLWALAAGVGLAAHALGRGPRAAVARAFWFGLPAMVAVAAQLAFRVSYYGDVVPNTAHVKAELDASSLGPGAAFVRDALAAMPALSAAAALGLVGALLARRTRGFACTLLLPALCWLTYLCVIGGDHFPGLRLMHGALAPLALLATLGLLAVPAAPLRAAAAVTVGVLGALIDLSTARGDPRSAAARGETWEWHGRVLGEALGRAFGARQPRVAVDAAGALPYYSQLPALDMLGLCDRKIATTPFAGWLATTSPGTPKPPGHLRGNGDYVMQQRPDLMLFSNPPGLPLPVFVSACEFEDDPRFLQSYRLVLLDLGAPEILPGVQEPHLAALWVRVDGRAGLRREGPRRVVPAYLFGALAPPGPAIRRHQPPTGDPQADADAARNLNEVAAFYTARRHVAAPAADGALELVLARDDEASLDLALDDGAGTWRARCLPQGVATAQIRAGQGEAGQARVTIRASVDGARIRHVVLERAPR